MMWLFVGLLCVLAGAALLAANGRSKSRAEQLCALFELDPKEYELLGSDLGGGPDKVLLRADGLIGAPDAVFRSRRDGKLVIGEAKSRRFGRHGIRPNELYQVLLYIGAAKKVYRTEVRGVLRYGCGRWINIPADDDAYRRLLRLVPCYRKVSVRLGRGRQRRRGQLRLSA